MIKTVSKNYLSPQVEVVELEVEQGYATSIPGQEYQDLDGWFS